MRSPSKINELQGKDSLNAAHGEAAGVVASTKSPFKTLVKQQPVEADASVVPMETETNVKDDDAEYSPLQKQTNNFNALQHEYGGGSSQNPNKQSFSTKTRNNYRQTLSQKYQKEGVDVSSITPFTRFPDGPSYAELCEDCRFNRLSTDSQRKNQMRLVILDCRASMLQKEAMLPRSGKIDINNNCDKMSLVDQVKGLVEDCKDQTHICLVGLNSMEVPKDYNDAQE
jgi:hypothetical protein